MSTFNTPIGSMRILVNPMLDSMPRMQLLPETCAIVTPEFAARMNQWMREFFGTTQHIVRLDDGTLVVGPKTLAAMRTLGGTKP